jgi:tetratricopeptide (TPR) repeat protein
MDPALEHTVLHLAVSKGYLTEVDLARLPPGDVEAPESRLESLVENGLLDAETLSLLYDEAQELVGTAHESWPVKSWSRYRVLGIAGSGAMGSVFKALDPKLDRIVALKFLRSHDPALIERFRREAQAQARVDHPNICKVYEVGEVDGHHYIAMQFIEGEPLTAVAPRLTLDQKLQLMKRVAEALHEAHRAGLIHRDVKPGNIMVEHTAAGGWRPSVVDFGLARHAADPGMTVPGSLLGTPQYMSPEQARGRHEELDRRSDVYGLGATLYAILTGCPPFAGSHTAEVVQQVLEEIPRAPRAIRPDIPRDVESITMQCLRKKPAERYGSARALAEDLGRYLDGDPVSARSTGTLYRLRMKAAKRKLEVATAVVAICALLIAGVWALHERWRTERISRLAQSFGQQVERVEALARHAALVPLHDTRPERALIRERMKRIEKQMEDVGGIAAGPGHYALGRGCLALGSYESAREHLQAAWDGGYREPETAYALGLVLAELYEQAMHRTVYIRGEPHQAAMYRTGAVPEGAEQRAERHRIEQQYREPALEFLRLSEGVEIENPAYVEALLAYYEGRYDEALAKARDAADGRPWFYEAAHLQGEVHTAVAEEKAGRGEFEAAAAAFQEAEEALQRSLSIGTSDANVYLALGALQRKRMTAEISNRGSDVEPFFRKGLHSVEQSLLVLPENVEAFNLEADLHQRLGAYLRSRGEDPTDQFRASVAAAEKSLQMLPENAVAYDVLGSAYRQLAKYEEGREEDPSASFTKAAQAYEAAQRIDPLSVSYSSLGLLFKSQARWLMSRGGDPQEVLAKSVRAFEEGLKLAPHDIGLLNNVGNTYATLAEYLDDAGEDPTEALESAAAAFRGALEVNPDQAIVLYGLGTTLTRRSEYVLERGGDPALFLQDALGVFSRAIEVNPESAYLAYFHDGRGQVYTLRGDFECRRGADPNESYQLAVTEYHKALEANPNYVISCCNLARVQVSRAEHELDVGGTVQPFLDSARAHCEEALEIHRSLVPAYHNLADVHRVEARRLMAQHADPTASFREARAALGKALEINASFAAGFVTLAQVSVLEGCWHMENGQDPRPSFEEAREHLRRGLELDAGNVDGYLEMAEVCRRLAEWDVAKGQPATNEIEEGLQMADKALSLRERLGRARALRAALLFCRAECEVDESRRALLLRQASDSVREAFEWNGHLRGRYALEAERIHQALDGV